MAAELRSSLVQEWESFKAPPAKEVAPAPKPGEKAPVNENLALPTGKPTLIVFLRHCGCPFAEKTFNALTKISHKYKDSLHCIAVSHSSPEATERWVVQVGGNWEVQVVVDHERELYSQWGLDNAIQLGKKENIWNRPTESGSRWQTSGAFAVDQEGVVRWARVAPTASDQPNFDEALTALSLMEKNPGGK